MTARPSSTGDIIGTVVGHYRITAELNTGGMGAVYRAEHELIGKAAAVKLLRPELSNDPEMLHRFFNEAKAATAIRHPGIVEVFDFGHHADGRAYIVMEFLDGETLSSRLAARGRLAEREVAVIARGIASALGAAHAKGIIHRDLKPDNVFLVPDPDMPTGERPKVLDFGIAKLVDHTNNSQKTQTGVFMGTPAYMAPEQARGAGDISPRADLYSLGCMLYEMVVGEPPFLADGAGEIIALQLFGEVEPPRARVPSLSPQLDALIMQMLEKDPANRPASALAVADALSQAMPTYSARVSDTTVTQQGGPATAQRPVVAATPRPARAATPRPGELGVAPTQMSVMPRPTTLGSSVGQSVAPVAPRKSKGPLIAAAAIAIVAAAAVVGFVVMNQGTDAPATTGPRAATEPAASEPAPPAEVVVTLVLEPAEATVTIDGVPRELVDGAITLPRDTGDHQLEVSAEGHAARTMKLRTAGDQTMTITLSPLPKVTTAAPPAKSKPARPKPKRQPKAKPRPGEATTKGSPIEETL